MPEKLLRGQSIHRWDYNIDTVSWARNQARDVVAHVLDQSEIPKVYDSEIERLSTYQEVYMFLDSLMAEDGYIRPWADRVVSLDKKVQKEFILWRLGKTKLDLETVQLWQSATKIDSMVIAEISDEVLSYDDIKDDETVLSWKDFWNLNKKLKVTTNMDDFTVFCREILWIQEWQKYRLQGSYRQYAYIVHIVEGEVKCEPDLQGSDSDQLPVIRKWSNDEFIIEELSLQGMPDQTIPEQSYAQSVFDSMRDWEWKNDIEITKWTVFFKDPSLNFGVLLFDSYIQLREEIDTSVMSQFDWSAISKYLYGKWLSKEERMVFYTGVMQMSSEGKYKTSTLNKSYPVCVDFEDSNIRISTDLENDGSLPMRKKVHP